MTAADAVGIIVLRKDLRVKASCRLVVLAGGPRPAELALTAATIAVGRDDDNAIQLDDASVSRHHALLSRSEDTYRLRDLGSRNGTFVNDQPVQEVVLQSGDQIRIGNVVFRFERLGHGSGWEADDSERLKRENQSLAAELATLRERLTAAEAALANRSAVRQRAMPAARLQVLRQWPAATRQPPMETICPDDPVHKEPAQRPQLQPSGSTGRSGAAAAASPARLGPLPVLTTVVERKKRASRRWFSFLRFVAVLFSF